MSVSAACKSGVVRSSRLESQFLLTLISGIINEIFYSETRRANQKDLSRRINGRFFYHCNYFNRSEKNKSLASTSTFLRVVGLCVCDDLADGHCPGGRAGEPDHVYEQQPADRRE